MSNTEELIDLPIKFGDWDEVKFTESKEDVELFSILVVDVETTGVSHVKDEVIELGGVLVKVNPDFSIHSVTPAFNWLREPATAEILPFITNLTGITKEMVSGKKVDEAEFLRWAKLADLIVAHNAWFDRPMVEKTVPGLLALDKPWACSCWDPNWKSLGYSKKKLEYLINKNGYKFPAHRAINDTIAVAYLMTMEADAVQAIVEKGTHEGFSLEYTSPPREAKKFMKDNFGFAFRAGKMQKYYTSLNALKADRAKITQYFEKRFNGAHQCYPRRESPQTRFRREV